MNTADPSAIAQILTELVDAWNAHSAARVAAFYTDDYIGLDVSISKQQRGQEAVRETVQHYLDAFPDLIIRVEDTIISQSKVAIKVQVNGTQRGVILKIPATGCPIEVHGVAFLSFDNGKINAASYLWDVAGFLRSIGLLPDL